LGHDPVGDAQVLNEAVSIYFPDATLASAFIARWCAGYEEETAEGVFRLRADKPVARTAASMYRTPRRSSYVDTLAAC